MSIIMHTCVNVDVAGGEPRERNTTVIFALSTKVKAPKAARAFCPGSILPLSLLLARAAASRSRRPNSNVLSRPKYELPQA